MAVVEETGATVAAAPRPRGGPLRSVRDSLVVAKRNLLRMMRIPEMVVFGLVQPIMFVVLFSYVFGGAIMVPGQASADATVYREFLMAGIFAQTVTFATAGAGAGIADDMHKGLIDRFRSLPMARGAVLTGRTLADLVQTALTLVVLAIVAVIVGWRVHDGVLKALGAFALLLLLGYAFSWIGALIGLSVRTPEAATSGGLIWLSPLTFISNAFVPSSKITAVLGHIADWNPFSATVQAFPAAVRQSGGRGLGCLADAAPGAGVILWSLLIIVLFRTLAVRKYRSATA
ncbi:Transport permease protein OS=Streptomyces antimycoticus OX=68175 GN=SANT12839_059520 PE=3 SV=1 [Streptomyces antimycoticus]